MGERRGRRPKLNGRLARQGAQGLRFAKIACENFAPVPSYFGDNAADCYALIVTELAEANALARADVILIEMTSRAYERWRMLDEMIVANDVGDLASGEVGDKGFLSGLAQARATAAKELRSNLIELGFTPSARIKTAGALQSNFLDLLELEEAPKAMPASDPFAPNVVQMKRQGEQ
ncbi:MAG: P27 family phage terminase small subunit [Pseudomonadota bacterium]